MTNERRLEVLTLVAEDAQYGAPYEAVTQEMVETLKELENEGLVVHVTSYCGKDFDGWEITEKGFETLVYLNI